VYLADHCFGNGVNPAGEVGTTWYSDVEADVQHLKLLDGKDDKHFIPRLLVRFKIDVVVIANSKWDLPHSASAEHETDIKRLQALLF
jgi:hypothetical protein